MDSQSREPALLERIEAALDGWPGLLRIIGGAFVSYVAGYLIISLSVVGPMPSRGSLFRLLMLGLAGIGLSAGRRGRWIVWLAIAALAIYTIAMGRLVFARAFDPWLTAGLLARIALIGVLLHPQARRAMDREPAEQPPPRPWMRTLVWLCVLIIVSGPVELALRVLVG